MAVTPGSGDLQRRLGLVVAVSGRTSPVLHATNRCWHSRRALWKVVSAAGALPRGGASDGDLTGLLRAL